MRITSTVLHRLSPHLFGHFLERASWGEPGCEAARLPGTRDLDPRVVDVLGSFRIPVIRWPAGTDLSWIDWRDQIDHVPGRTGPRPPFLSGHPDARGPLSNEFGLEEFLALCRRLGAAPLLPVPLEPALGGAEEPEALALRHAGLVAYCNAPLGARLPPGMPDWPAVRAANGHPEPHRVRWFQLGNEVYCYFDRAHERAGLGRASTMERYGRYRRVLDACIDAMRAIDPAIELIMEAAPAPREPEIEEWLLTDGGLRARVPWCVYHDYRPWEIGAVLRDGTAVDPATLTADEIWNAWVASAPAFAADGQAAFRRADRAADLGWRIAITEWNWNGWWRKGLRPALDSELAKGVGAAGILHALMRQPAVGIACQSMLIGCSWGLAGIAIDRQGGLPPRPRPTGLAVGLYARHHGDRVVALERTQPAGYRQPLRMNCIPPCGHVAWLDAVCTADDRAWYLHLVNRRSDRPEALELDLTACGALRPQAAHHILDGSLDGRDAGIRRAEAAIAGPRLRLDIPPRSVSVLVLERSA